MQKSSNKQESERSKLKGIGRDNLIILREALSDEIIKIHKRLEDSEVHEVQKLQGMIKAFKRLDRQCRQILGIQ